MKNLIWFIVGAGLFYYLYDGSYSHFVVPQQIQIQRPGQAINQIEFMTLFNQQRPFSGLADDNYYTVVEVYLDSCAVCKRLEKGFEPFLRKRKDVLIKRIHFPESGMNFSINSQQEADELQSRIESYRVCGTPHVEIYGPDQQLISADDCGAQQGTKYLRQWISAETGISRHSL